MKKIDAYEMLFRLLGIYALIQLCLGVFQSYNLWNIWSGRPEFNGTAAVTCVAIGATVVAAAGIVLTVKAPRLARWLTTKNEAELGVETENRMSGREMDFAFWIAVVGMYFLVSWSLGLVFEVSRYLGNQQEAAEGLRGYWSSVPPFPINNILSVAIAAIAVTRAGTIAAFIQRHADWCRSTAETASDE